MDLEPNESSSGEKGGVSPLEKEQPEPWHGGVKSARGWLGRAKSFGGRAAREQCI